MGKSPFNAPTNHHIPGTPSLRRIKFIVMTRAMQHDMVKIPAEIEPTRHAAGRAL
jgi:hypothetical protein